MSNFLKKSNFPYTYGDDTEDQIMVSDHVVELLESPRFQSHMTAVLFAWFTVVSYAKPSSAIPTEYGEFANEAIQAAQGGAPQVPPIGPIDANVAVPGGPPVQAPGPIQPGPNDNILRAMPIEQQRLIAQQQAATYPGNRFALPGTSGVPGGPPGQAPTSHPAFYVPAKPQSATSRGLNTFLFSTAMGVICINAVWGEPVAIVMCASGLVSIASKIGRDVVLAMAKHLK